MFLKSLSLLLPRRQKPSLILKMGHLVGLRIGGIAASASGRRDESQRTDKNQNGDHATAAPPCSSRPAASRAAESNAVSSSASTIFDTRGGGRQACAPGSRIK